MKLQNLYKSYGTQEVFRDFSLDIREGEILCVLGESGGGKTTLLNILAGLLSCEKGEVETAENISYIFQEHRLLPHLTVRENLAYVGGEKEKIEELLRVTELLKVADKRPTMLSGGEKQRVAIARAFCVPFSLLLMDEPFSSLDTGLKLRLINVFANLWNTSQKNETKTAVFVTHDLEEALMISDRIVVLRAGNIVGDFFVEKDKFPAEYGAENPLRKKILDLLLDV